MIDYLVVGSGLTGATIARHLHDLGRDVLVVERRDHVGGNVHDHDLHGVRVHTYGPHYFRTNNDRIWAWVNRFATWWDYQPSLMTLVDGELEHWPVTQDYIDRHCGAGWKPAFPGTPQNFEEACLATMPALIYERFVKGYTELQWGQPAATLDASLAGRFHIANGDLRLKAHKHQGIPTYGYARFTENILDGIPVHRGVDWLNYQGDYPAKQTIYTGPIDALYGYDMGKLAYRSQHRQHTWRPTLQQPCGQVNNPAGPHVRTLEWTHMAPPTNKRGSVTTTETPFTPQDPDQYEYPYPDQRNRDLYKQYRARANQDPTLLVCGRLGEYRYFDMDQAIARAMLLAQRLTGGKGCTPAPSVVAR